MRSAAEPSLRNCNHGAPADRMIVKERLEGEVERLVKIHAASMTLAEEASLYVSIGEDDDRV